MFDERLQKSIERVIEAAMHDTAPLYAAYPTLFEWLARHGVVIFQSHDLYFAQSSAASSSGIELNDGRPFPSFSAVLEFALNQCAENIRKDDIRPP